MKLKNILLSEGRTNSINFKEAKSIFEQNIESVWDFNNTMIYRGVTGFSSPYGIVKPKKYERKSENTQNYYTLLIDNSGKWSQFPKRSESIICSTNLNTAIEYGKPYLVLPFVNSKIGVAPSEDIWDSFSIKLSNFNLYLEKLKRQATKVGENIPNTLPEKNFKKFKELIEEIDWRLKTDRGRMGRGYDDLKNTSPHGFKEFIRNYLDSSKDLLNYIKSILNPEKNGFSLVRYQKGFSVPSNREVWTDSSSLLINVQDDDYLEEFFGESYLSFMSKTT